MAKGRPKEFEIDPALDAALGLFWRRGYEGTSVAALTDVMRISAPSLYAAFGNKQSLFRKVLDRYLQGPASYLINSLRQPTARLVVQRMLDGAIDLAMQQVPPTGCLLVQGALSAGPTGESAREALGSVRRAAETAVRRRFEKAVAADDLPADTDAAALARYVIAVIWGLSVLAAGDATRRQLRDVADVVLSNWPT